MKSSKKFAYQLVIITIVLILAAVGLNFSLLYSFGASILLAIIVFNAQGYDVRSLLRSALADTLQYKWLYVTVVLIGATVAIWLSSGTIATMIYYGFDYIEGVNFVLFSFVAVTVCSLFMGTAVGTFSTIGLILYSIGSIIGIPSGLLVGAIVSGSFISDKLSPISGLVNINLQVTEVKYNNVLKYVWKTLFPSLLITGVIFYFLGKEYVVYDQGDTLQIVQGQLASSFNIQPILLLFPIVILTMSMLGINSLYTVLTGIGLGSLFSFFVQKQSISEIIHHLIYGFQDKSGGELAHILRGGGLLRMLEVAVIGATVIFFVNLLMKSGTIDQIVGDFVRSIDSPRQLLQKTGILSIILTVLTCDQTVGLVLTATLLRELYDKFGIKREVLFRTLSDTGVIVAPLFAWNLNYLIITSVIGKGISFVPYAALCFVAPLVSLASSFFYSGEKIFE